MLGHRESLVEREVNHVLQCVQLLCRHATQKDADVLSARSLDLKVNLRALLVG